MDIFSSLALVGASFGIVTLLGTLVWCWVNCRNVIGSIIVVGEQ